MVIQIQYKDKKTGQWKTDPFGYRSYDSAKADMWLVKARFKRLVGSRIKKVM